MHEHTPLHGLQLHVTLVPPVLVLALDLSLTNLLRAHHVVADTASAAEHDLLLRLLGLMKQELKQSRLRGRSYRRELHI